MAAVTHLGASGSSTNNPASYATAAGFSPAVGDLLVVFVILTGCVQEDLALTETAGGGTYSLVRVQAWSGTASRCAVFVADQLCAATTSRNFTLTRTGGNFTSTGCAIVVAKTTGMTLSGVSSIRSKGSFKNGAGTTPTANFDAAATPLTTNPVIGFCAHGGAANAQTQPSGWSEKHDGAVAAFTTPAGAIEYAAIDSGFTNNTVTWGASSTPAWGTIIIELDASAPTTVTCGALDMTGSASITVAASLHKAVSGAIALTGAGAVTVAGSLHTAFGGAIALVGTGAVVVANAHAVKTSGVFSLTGNAAVIVAGSHQEALAGLLDLTGASVIVVADSTVIPAGGSTVTSDPLSLDASAGIEVADSHAVLTSGVVSLSGAAAVDVADTLLLVESGVFSLLGHADISVDDAHAVKTSGPLSLVGNGRITVILPLIRKPTTSILGNRKLIEENIGDILAIDTERAEVRSNAAGSARKRMVSLGSWLLGIRLDYAADVDAGCELVVSDAVRTLLTITGNTDGFYPVREEIVDNTGAGLNLYEPPIIIQGEVIVTLTGAGAGKSVFVTIFTQ